MIKIFTVEDKIEKINYSLENDGIVIIVKNDDVPAKKKMKELKNYLENKNDEDFWDDNFEENIEALYAVLPYENNEVGFVFDDKKFNLKKAQKLAQETYEEKYGNET